MNVQTMIDDSPNMNILLKGLDNNAVKSLLMLNVNPNTFYFRNVSNGIVEEDYFYVQVEAVKNNRMDILNLLLVFGLKQRVISGDSLTLLTYALSIGNLEAVDVLLRNGFDMNFKINGYNQLFALMAQKDIKVMSYLVRLANEGVLEKLGLNFQDKDRKGFNIAVLLSLLERDLESFIESY